MNLFDIATIKVSNYYIKCNFKFIRGVKNE